MKMWIPVTAKHLATFDRRSVIHAATWEAVMDARKAGHRTIPTLCGRKRTKGYGVHAVSSEGCLLGVSLMCWPPRLRLLREEESRCRECWELSGKPRPDAGWDALTQTADGAAPEPCDEVA